MVKRRRRSQKAGLPPGTMVHIGEERLAGVKIRVIDYSEADFQEKEVECLDACCPFRDTPNVTWINVDGIHEVPLLEKFGECFGLHPLVLEDIVNTEQRPKMEDFENYLFVVLKMLYYDEKEREVKGEQISLVVGSNFVLSFQETVGDIFDPIRERLRKAKGNIRKRGADYLAYCLIDAIVDSYFLILEKVGEDVEELEDELVENPTQRTLTKIHDLKSSMLFLRRSVWPLREIVSGLERAESSLIKKATKIYLRDVYDHTIQVMDTVETYRDMLAGMLDIYLSSISNKLNEVMKVLTIIATIFIPLTFITGLYGMNFNTEASPYNMPELGWAYGYPAIWVVMALVAASMLLYFKKKKWL